MTEGRNPLTVHWDADPEIRLKEILHDLKRRWAANDVKPAPIQFSAADPAQPRRNWLPGPQWVAGLDAFNIFKFQSRDDAHAIAQICITISDQVDRASEGPNYRLEKLPPSHPILSDFELGTNQWFRAAHSLLTIRKAEEIAGRDRFVADFHEWLIYDYMRIVGEDVKYQSLQLDWPYIEYSLPEIKQTAIWHFPHALAWIATRSELALARMGSFYKSDSDDEYVTDGVTLANTMALGWLHTAATFARCKCRAFETYQWEAIRHCTCLSTAWEDLVHFTGGISDQTPELIFSAEDNWFSMTWPVGAEKIRFLRKDILAHWPAPTDTEASEPARIEHSTTAGERECRDWLANEFSRDPERRRSKADFRNAALVSFSGRLTERGFNLRVWPELARQHGRDSAGAKRKL